jgi:hypothetical protein
MGGALLKIVGPSLLAEDGGMTLDLLHDIGLGVCRLCGDWDGQPLGAESRRMIVIGEKPRTWQGAVGQQVGVALKL